MLGRLKESDCMSLCSGLNAFTILYHRLAVHIYCCCFFFLVTLVESHADAPRRKDSHVTHAFLRSCTW